MTMLRLVFCAGTALAAAATAGSAQDPALADLPNDEALDAADLAACQAAGGDEASCAAGEAALELRQLRAGSLQTATEEEATATDEVEEEDDLDAEGKGGKKGKGGKGHPAHVDTALLQRASESSDSGVKALAETLMGKSQVVYGYHQTSIPICHQIIKTGFRPGSRGWCGGAIYFADTRAGTFGEAVGKDSHQGCIIKAKIDMGKVKDMGRTCDYRMNGGRLKGEGYDSIRFNDGMGTGEQFVIYDPSRVLSMEIISEDPNWHGPPQMQNPHA